MVADDERLKIEFGKRLQILKSFKVEPEAHMVRARLFRVLLWDPAAADAGDNAPSRLMVCVGRSKPQLSSFAPSST